MLGKINISLKDFQKLFVSNNDPEKFGRQFLGNFPDFGKRLMSTQHPHKHAVLRSWGAVTTVANSQVWFRGAVNSKF